MKYLAYNVSTQPLLVSLFCSSSSQSLHLPPVSSPVTFCFLQRLHLVSPVSGLVVFGECLISTECCCSDMILERLAFLNSDNEYSIFFPFFTQLHKIIRVVVIALQHFQGQQLCGILKDLKQ